MLHPISDDRTLTYELTLGPVAWNRLTPSGVQAAKALEAAGKISVDRTERNWKIRGLR